MRCPKCKTTLIKDEPREYETLLEHVSDPNQEKFPLRPIYVCPNKCFGERQFFGIYGSSYGEGGRERRYWSSLDSIDRQSRIGTHLDMLYGRYKGHVIALKNLVIKGEKDIPPRWTWRFYWIRGRLVRFYYRHFYPIKKKIRKRTKGGEKKCLEQ